MTPRTPTSYLGWALFAGMLCLHAAHVPAGEPSLLLPPDAEGGTVNHCAAPGVRVESTAPFQASGGKDMLGVEGEIMVQAALPQSITVSFPAPVILNGCAFRWHGREKSGILFATWYGVEGWNDDGWILLVEERANERVESEHRFPPVRTDRVRITVFRHPPGYQSLYLRQFSALLNRSVEAHRDAIAALELEGEL